MALLTDQMVVIRDVRVQAGCIIKVMNLLNQTILLESCNGPVNGVK